MKMNPDIKRFRGVRIQSTINVTVEITRPTRTNDKQIEIFR